MPESSIARGPGVTVLRSTSRPSDLETTFCANTSTSSARSRNPASARARAVRPARSSTGAISGNPGRANRPSSAGLAAAGSTIFCPQPGQHLLGVQPEEAALIRSRCMEHAVPETQLDVRLEHAHVLVRIRGDDPALRRALSGESIRYLLHLERILERISLFLAERECGPVPRVLQRALPVRVIGHLQLDHPLERIGR